MKFYPYPYQQTAVQWLIDKPRACLFLDCGLGKSVITLTAFLQLQDSCDVDTMLVVAPKKVAETTWSSECEKWSHLAPLRTSVVMGTPKQRELALKAPADIYVIGRDSFVWLCEYYRYRLPYDMLCIDELTSFKTPKAKRFKAMRKVTPCFSRVVGLTGTPAPNGFLDLWAQLYCIDQGERLGRSVTKFRDTYFDLHKWNNIVVRCTLKHGMERIIRDRIKDICLSMQAKDYLSLPDLITIRYTVALPDAIMHSYHEFERDQVLQLKEQLPSVATESQPSNIVASSAAALMVKLSQYANGAVYDADGQAHEIHEEKLHALAEIIEMAASPVLVFYQYRHDVPRIEAALKGLNVRIYEGAQDLADWNAGRIDVLLAHPASTAYGLNMQQGGHYIVWFGTGWNLELYQQANARLHRQGQAHPVTVYNLVCRDTVDERALAALSGKRTLQQTLLDNLNYLLQKYQQL